MIDRFSTRYLSNFIPCLLKIRWNRDPTRILLWSIINFGIAAVWRENAQKSHVWNLFLNSHVSLFAQECSMNEILEWFSEYWVKKVSLLWNFHEPIQRFWETKIKTLDLYYISNLWKSHTSVIGESIWVLHMKKKLRHGGIQPDGFFSVVCYIIVVGYLCCVWQALLEDETSIWICRYMLYKCMFYCCEWEYGYFPFKNFSGDTMVCFFASSWMESMKRFAGKVELKARNKEFSSSYANQFLKDRYRKILINQNKF